jgi:hypothetical protein
MMIWPEYVDWPDEALQNFTGNKIIYIGDLMSCAADEFYERCENEWNNVKTIKIPQWENCYDDVKFYERK